MSGATSTTTPISGEAAELVNKQETLNWRAFCRRAQPTPSQAMASKGRQTGSRILQCTTAGCGLDEPHLRRIFSRCEWFRGRLGKDVPWSGSPAVRRHCSHPNLVWAAPVLRPDMIFRKGQASAFMLPLLLRPSERHQRLNRDRLNANGCESRAADAALD